MIHFVVRCVNILINSTWTCDRSTGIAKLHSIMLHHSKLAVATAVVGVYAVAVAATAPAAVAAVAAALAVAVAAWVHACGALTCSNLRIKHLIWFHKSHLWPCLEILQQLCMICFISIKRQCKALEAMLEPPAFLGPA